MHSIKSLLIIFCSWGFLSTAQAAPAAEAGAFNTTEELSASRVVYKTFPHYLVPKYEAHPYYSVGSLQTGEVRYDSKTKKTICTLIGFDFNPKTAFKSCALQFQFNPPWNDAYSLKGYGDLGFWSLSRNIKATDSWVDSPGRVRKLGRITPGHIGEDWEVTQWTPFDCPKYGGRVDIEVCPDGKSDLWLRFFETAEPFNGLALIAKT